MDSQRFERSRSREVAEAVAQFNASSERGQSSVPSDRSGAVGIERSVARAFLWSGMRFRGRGRLSRPGFRDFRVTPSQGSHFFQNLTAFQVGYFTVNPDAGEGSVDWEWLADQPAAEERGCVRHLQFAQPLRVVMNSKTGQGLILSRRLGSHKNLLWQGRVG